MLMDGCADVAAVCMGRFAKCKCAPANQSCFSRC